MWRVAQALQKNGGQALPEAGKTFILHKPIWARFPENKIGPK